MASVSLVALLARRPLFPSDAEARFSLRGERTHPVIHGTATGTRGGSHTACSTWSEGLTLGPESP